MIEAVVQVFDGDGTGGPTEAELLAKKKEYRHRRLERALRLADEHNIVLVAQDYTTYLNPGDYHLSDGILIAKIEEQFGRLEIGE